MSNILRLRDLLKKKKTTGKSLAERVGVSENTISFILTGKTHPRPELLLKIATALDVDLKDLFISTKPQKNPKEIIGTIRDAINDLEALYDAKDTA
jgi:transcriptional regulator with XRE-family HTH domain